MQNAKSEIMEGLEDYYKDLTEVNIMYRIGYVVLMMRHAGRVMMTKYLVCAITVCTSCFIYRTTTVPSPYAGFMRVIHDRSDGEIVRQTDKVIAHYYNNAGFTIVLHDTSISQTQKIEYEVKLNSANTTILSIGGYYPAEAWKYLDIPTHNYRLLVEFDTLQTDDTLYIADGSIRALLYQTITGRLYDESETMTHMIGWLVIDQTAGDTLTGHVSLKGSTYVYSSSARGERDYVSYVFCDVDFHASNREFPGDTVSVAKFVLPRDVDSNIR